MSWEVSYIALLLQIPDFNLGVFSSSTEDETVRMELGGGEAHTREIADLSEQCASANVGKGPVLIGGCGQDVVASRVE